MVKWRTVSQTPPVIAVLDDEPKMRKALHRLLTSHGLRVNAYESGSEFFCAQSTHPADCLILDLHIPEVSGFAVLAAFDALHIKTPVIVLTGHDEPDASKRVRALGASAYLTKPVDESALLEAIQSALRQSNLCSPFNNNQPSHQPE